MIRRSIWILLVVAFASGCGSSPEQAISDKDAKAMTVTTPNATAADAQKALAESNLPPEAKRVIGGGGAPK